MIKTHWDRMHVKKLLAAFTLAIGVFLLPQFSHAQTIGAVQSVTIPGFTFDTTDQTIYTFPTSTTVLGLSLQNCQGGLGVFTWDNGGIPVYCENQWTINNATLAETAITGMSDMSGTGDITIYFLGTQSTTIAATTDNPALDVSLLIFAFLVGVGMIYLFHDWISK